MANKPLGAAGIVLLCVAAFVTFVCAGNMAWFINTEVAVILACVLMLSTGLVFVGILLIVAAKQD
jgi:hypothetical protein